jgi:hypothetical protein
MGAEHERSVSQGKICPSAKSYFERGETDALIEVGDVAYWPPGPDIAIF